MKNEGLREPDSIWFVRCGGDVWFARGPSKFLLGPFRSSADAKAAIIDDQKAVHSGELDLHEADRRSGSRDQEYDRSEFPKFAACIEEFDSNLSWSLYLLVMKSGGELYIVETPNGPLPDVYFDRRRSRLAAITAKAHAEVPRLGS